MDISRMTFLQPNFYFQIFQMDSMDFQLSYSPYSSLGLFKSDLNSYLQQDFQAVLPSKSSK